MTQLKRMSQLMLVLSRSQPTKRLGLPVNITEAQMVMQVVAEDLLNVTLVTKLVI